MAFWEKMELERGHVDPVNFRYMADAVLQEDIREHPRFCLYNIPCKHIPTDQNVGPLDQGFMESVRYCSLLIKIIPTALMALLDRHFSCPTLKKFNSFTCMTTQMVETPANKLASIITCFLWSPPTPTM